ncbi:hypothetical protein [Alloprevotella tannerae]|uniref:Uncharacterized protein n=1 Tax=Alloprevotella tannerae TaxID=76122 RepID=A0A929RZ38_9BACT|nr:hypothetical protein [Alloprevotella tannerae]MBF0970507.1 hypothetical protein [Alloprevotella tannerae]
MNEKRLMTADFMNAGGKQTYVQPVCQVYGLDAQMMLAGSVSGDTDNKDIGQDPSDPWYTGQD